VNARQPHHIITRDRSRK